MDINSLKSKYGIELGRNWRPKKDYNTLISTFLPWAVGFAVFLFILGLVYFLQARWSGSPLFILLSTISRLIAGLFSFVGGIILGIVTGNSQLIKKVFSTIGYKPAATTMIPLIFAIILSRYMFGIVKNVQITSFLKRLFLTIIFLLLFGCLLFPTQQGLGAWVRDLCNLIKFIFSD